MVYHGIVVTGASRGLGRSIVLSFAKHYPGEKHFIITGRNTLELEKLKVEVENMQTSSGYRCDLLAADLADINKLPATADALFNLLHDSNLTYSHITLVNNAGSLGPLVNVGSSELSFNQMRSAFDFNVTSCCFLTSDIVRRVREGFFGNTCNNLTLVNISSLAALQPFDCWGIYCAGKAARDMYFKTLAEEIKNTNPTEEKEILVLNYAPGPLNTDMQKEIRESTTLLPSLKQYFIDKAEQNELVDVTESSDKLVKILVKKCFTSGAHIDFYDKISDI